MDLKQFTTYQGDLSSFDLMNSKIGLMKPGRYSGFNEITNTGILAYTISHDTNFYRSVDKVGGTRSNFGTFIFQTGQVYQDNDSVDIVIPATPNIPFRFDALVASVTYSEDVNGNTISYQILDNAFTGFDADQDPRDLPNDLSKTFGLSNNQILIGWFKVEQIDSAITDAGIVYYPSSEALMLGYDTIKNQYENTLQRLVEESLREKFNLPYVLSDIADIENANDHILTIYNGDEPKYGNRVIYVHGSTDNLAKPLLISLSPLLKAGTKLRFVWDQLRVTINAAGVTLLHPADKLPQTRVVGSEIIVTCIDSALDAGGTGIFLVTGDLASV